MCPSPPLDAPDAGFNLRDLVGDEAVADAMSAFSRMRFQHQRLLETLGARLGISSSDIRALFFLAANAQATPKSTADFLGVTTGAMTSLLDRNERAGLLTRSPHPQDRRSTILQLTPAGHEAVERWGATYRGAFRDAIEPDRLVATTRLFRRIAEELAGRADALATDER
ncbi:MAG: MarR family transcriptional regulator [Micrococcales bacterium]|nr:MarR family transcriptional regulator [Micrococcales bacterium]